MNTTSKTQGPSQGFKSAPAGPVDPRESRSADAQEDPSQKEAARPIPWGTGKEDDAVPSSDGDTQNKSPATDGADRQDGSGESPTGGDPRTPNIPGT